MISLGLHVAALAAAAALLGLPVRDHYWRDAPPAPALQVSMVAVAPPALALDGLLGPLEEVIVAFSKVPSASRGRPSEPAREREAKAQTVYYSAREVDVRAVPLAEIVPINPDVTGRESGTVVLRLFINAAGTVDNVMVQRAEPERAFSSALLLPFRNARFAPARKNGRAVASEMLVEVRYAPDEETR